LMRVIPAASSGARSPLSAASTANRCDPHIDRNRAEPAGLERDAPGAHRRFIESRSRLLAEPGKEFVEPEIVDAARDRGGNAVQDQRF
jgi:hypothetical protein